MILILDSGFGVDKDAYRSGEDIKFEKHLPVYVEAPEGAEDMPLFEGKRYYYGEEALMEDSKDIINVNDYKTHEKFAPLSLWVVLDRLKLKSEDIDKLYIGLSLSQKEYAEQFIKRITKFKINGETYDFKDKITLVPQGVSAKYAIDHIYYGGDHTETYAIIDIGQLTVDTATIISGKVRLENADGMSNEGVIKIIQKIQEYIAAKFNEIISLKEAQNVLMTGKYNLFGEHDLSEIIEEYKTEYSKYIVSVLKSKYRNIFKKYPKIYFVGGGSYYINKDTLKAEAGINEKIAVFPKNAEYYNVIGGVYLAEKE